jgi:hypothetical protein
LKTSRANLTPEHFKRLLKASVVPGISLRDQGLVEVISFLAKLPILVATDDFDQL